MAFATTNSDGVDAGANGASQEPNESPKRVWEQQRRDKFLAELNEGMISTDSAFDMAAVFGRLAMKVLVCVALAQRDATGSCQKTTKNSSLLITISGTSRKAA